MITLTLVETTSTNQFGRLVPFDFINQIIPVLFKITGKEILDLSLAEPAARASLIQKQFNAINGIVPLTNTSQAIGPSSNVTNRSSN